MDGYDGYPVRYKDGLLGWVHSIRVGEDNSIRELALVGIDGHCYKVAKASINMTEGEFRLR